MNIYSLSILAPITAITLSAGDVSATNPVSELAVTLAQTHINSPEWAEIYGYLQDMKGEGINATICNGDTLLVYALSTPDTGLCQTDLIGAILLAGADVHVKQKGTGNSPLHLAASMNDYNIALRLIACGAKINTKNNAGKTPADLAREPHLKQLLRTGIPCELLTNKAKKAYQKAIEGNADACYLIGQLYYSGEGSDVAPQVSWMHGEEPLRDMSHFWQQLAARKGCIAAKANLGMLYYWGVEGVQQDEAKGYSLLKEAAECGHEGAIEIIQDNQAPATRTIPSTIPHGSTLIFSGIHSESGDVSTIVFGKQGQYPFTLLYYSPVSENLAEIGFRGGALIFNGTLLIEHQEGSTYTGRIGGTLTDKTPGAGEIYPLSFKLEIPSK